MLPPPPLVPCAASKAAIRTPAPTQHTSNGVAQLLSPDCQADSKAQKHKNGRISPGGPILGPREHMPSAIAALIKGDADTDDSKAQKHKDGRVSPGGPVLGPRSYDKTYAGLERIGAASDEIRNKGRMLGPRPRDASPRAPWALDENSPPAAPEKKFIKPTTEIRLRQLESGDQKLADVARSCLQQTELRHELEERLQFRPQGRARSPLNSRYNAARPKTTPNFGDQGFHGLGYRSEAAHVRETQAFKRRPLQERR